MGVRSGIVVEFHKLLFNLPHKFPGQPFGFGRYGDVVFLPISGCPKIASQA